MRRGASVCHMKERSATDASEWKMLVKLSDQHARSREIAARLNEPLVRKRMRTPNIQSRYRKTDRCLCQFPYSLLVKSFVRSFSSNESDSKKSTHIFINLSVNVLAYRLVIVDLR